MLTTHLHLVPRLRMSGAIPLLPLYDFMAWTETKFPYLLIFEMGYRNNVLFNLLKPAGKYVLGTFKYSSAVFRYRETNEQKILLHFVSVFKRLNYFFIICCSFQTYLTI
jgi:hypothetical protein